MPFGPSSLVAGKSGAVPGVLLSSRFSCPAARGPRVSRPLPRWVATAVLAWGACTGPSKQPPVALDDAPGPRPEDLGRETEIEARWDTELMPAFEAGAAGSFRGAAEKTVAYRVFDATAPRTDGARAVVVIVPGRTEPMRKYAEVIADVRAAGFDVVAMSLRGQGESERLAADPQLGHVVYFRDYVDDLGTLIDTVALPMVGSTRVFVLAHSTGGTVALHLAARRPGLVAAYALSSPMLAPDLGAFPPFVAESLSAGQCSRSAGETYAPGGGPYDPAAQRFEDNDVTRSAARFAVKVRMFQDHPALRLGGPSWRWVCEVATYGTATLRRMPDAVVDPVLVLAAGDDTVVRTDAARSFCDDAPRCQFEAYPGARHELLQEIDETRNVALARALRFFEHFARAGATP